VQPPPHPQPLSPEAGARGGLILPLAKLAKTARASRRLSTTAELEVQGRDAEVNASGQHTSSGEYYAGGSFSYEPEPATSFAAAIVGETLELAMLNQAKLFFKGKLKLDSVEVKASKCPLKRKELLRLARAAWCEAFGIEIPPMKAVEE
jgi:hypothetical protein